jgi:hypothetical protein
MAVRDQPASPDLVQPASPDRAATARLVTAGNGWARNSVNTVIFRRNSIVTYKHIQYIAYYDSAQNVVLGKRQSGSARWQLQVTPYKGNAADAHRSISIMTDGAGYLHVCWDHHDNALHYCRSINPGSLQLTGEMPMTGRKERRVTYPEFYRLPDGNLLFFYRDGGAGNGDLMLNRYDVKTKRWTQIQDGFINGEGQRSAYWQTTIDRKGVVHLSWVWREGAATGSIATNHDMCYASSEDNGQTWEKSTGAKYVLPITAATAEYAARIPQNSDLINSTSMATDSRDRPYICTYWRPAGETVPQYQLIFNDGTGWQIRRVSNRTTPFSLSGGGTKRIPLSRPQIVIYRKAGTERGILVFRDAERGNKVSVTVCNDLPEGKWEMKDLWDQPVDQWEPSYDTELWRQHGILDLFVQMADQGDGEKLEDIPPQPVSVLEWKPGLANYLK